ncbi:MAG: ParB/RepB/Spo0J family partition protein [Bacteroidales bacterium]|nr:ParB/RepB/Spo0J family partition protein [Bacteroidales bacterium]
MNKKTVLGRGLGALIEETEPETKVHKAVTGGTEIDVNLIDTNPFQPRSDFDKETLDELATSIREVGMVQPITVRVLQNGRYQLITGERRLRAAKMASILKIPAYIRTANDQGMLEMALVENIQREDLNALDISISYQRLLEECDMTQEDLSLRVGKKRATVANYIRLLKLPAEIQMGIRDNKISMGHARALVTMDEDPKAQIDLFYKIISEDLSVRKTEALVQKFNQFPKEIPEKIPSNQEAPQLYEELKNQLSGFFQTTVEFRRNHKGSGKIIIPFNSDDELERIIGIFDRLKV